MAESSTIILCKKARVAAEDVAALTTEQKNDALGLIADSLEAHMADILAANDEDIAAATGNIPDVMLDRLKLNEERVRGMVHAPLGVVAIIYESRPNGTSDAFALAFKSGNACVLRGGKESYRSSFAVVTAMKEALRKCCINEDAVGLVSDLTHDSANELMTAVGLVDLLIPRGGAGLIRRITENAKVPCIQTGSGICHVYVDNCADLPKAVNIVNNAKTQRPSVCNAEEVLLVHKDIAEEFLPMIKMRLVDVREKEGQVPVELRLCPRAAAIIPGTPAGPMDFDTEYNDYILSIKVVDSLDEAIRHIGEHSTGHSEAIVTGSERNAEQFVNRVDSAAVYVNVSTRFTDGGEFGLGCEMGISTQKLHARGPMGLEELTTWKYIIRGDGEIRE